MRKTAIAIIEEANFAIPHSIAKGGHEFVSVHEESVVFAKLHDDPTILCDDSDETLIHFLQEDVGIIHQAPEVNFFQSMILRIDWCRHLIASITSIRALVMAS